MNRVLQPRPLVVLGLNVWMGTAAEADELVGLRSRSVCISCHGSNQMVKKGHAARHTEGGRDVRPANKGAVQHSRKRPVLNVRGAGGVTTNKSLLVFFWILSGRDEFLLHVF